MLKLILKSIVFYNLSIFINKKKIYATESTSKFLKSHGIDCKLANWSSKNITENSAVK